MDLQRAINSELSVDGGSLAYVIEPGMTLKRITDDLAELGVLEDPRYLLLHARWKGVETKIKAGEYEIRPEMTASQLLTRFVEGGVIQRSVTLLEGWTFQQMMDAIQSNKHVQHTLDNLDSNAIMTQIDYPGILPEGRFYPDTYHFPRGTTDVAILKKAYLRMEERLEEEWRNRAADLPYETPYEALILASIVEKETGQAGERARIAGVFSQRLKKGMRLETDPTVIYGLGQSFDGNLRRRDLQQDTPYNTYTRKGLPPTPIAMPGGDAIHAALHPEVHNELFFVARGDGSHHFSKTYDEHLRAVNKYQLKRKERRKTTVAND